MSRRRLMRIEHSIMHQTLWQALSDRARRYAAAGVTTITRLDDWHRQRPTIHRQFMQSLGLHPLPPRCELKLHATGTFQGQGYRARKVAFQIMPDCWISAAIYTPADHAPDAAPRPGVLYVCGHAPLGIHHYQAHPIMWARRGYVCLIVETIEQSDNPGEHHGYLRELQDTWISLGYTPAGAETLSAMRALDVMASLPEVDADRLGVTGVSGGGSISFMLAMADDRIKAVSTLCGICTQIDAITHRHLNSNCDCFFFNNMHQRDWADFASLIAPRAALFCFAEHDPLFHGLETRDFFRRTSHVYALHDAAQACAFVSDPGPHGDHVAFDEATAAWFDRHVAGGDMPEAARGEREQSEVQTSVFNGRPPSPDHLHLLPELICTQGTVRLPSSPDEWETIKRDALVSLREASPSLFNVDVKMSLENTGQWIWATDRHMHEYRGSIDHQEVVLNLVQPPENPKAIIINLANPGQMSFHALARVALPWSRGAAGYGSFEGRMAGMNAVASGQPASPPGSFLASTANKLTQAMAIVGLSPVTVMVHDVLLLMDFLHSQEQYNHTAIYFMGRHEAAVAVLYAAMIDERIAGVLLQELPGTHREMAPIPGVLRAFDIPQAVGLMAPRKVAMVEPGHAFWTWPRRAYDRLGVKDRLIVGGTLDKVVSQLVTG